MKFKIERTSGCIPGDCQWLLLNDKETVIARSRILTEELAMDEVAEVKTRFKNSRIEIEKGAEIEASIKDTGESYHDFVWQLRENIRTRAEYGSIHMSEAASEILAEMNEMLEECKIEIQEPERKES